LNEIGPQEKKTNAEGGDKGKAIDDEEEDQLLRSTLRITNSYGQS
jgi:hypothetical protein